MTQTHKRIAIAKACGWTYIENINTMVAGGIWCGYPPASAIIGKKELLPDYFNDLNAMHEAERHLNLNLWDDYMKTLFRISQDPHICHTTHHMAYVCATADKRAEAFLETMGLIKLPATADSAKGPSASLPSF